MEGQDVNYISLLHMIEINFHFNFYLHITGHNNYIRVLPYREADD